MPRSGFAGSCSPHSILDPFLTVDRLVVLVSTLVLLTFAPAPCPARSPVTNDLSPRQDEFSGWYHNAGNLLLHVSNRGLFGSRGTDETYPSAEWPAGSNHEYLWAAGLWVAGVVDRGGVPDTLVSAGLYQQSREGINFEFFNFESDEGCDPGPTGICTTFEGAPSGLRGFDDDGDGVVDEDALDGADNDGDGRVDEDFAGIGQQMFRSVYYDTSTFFNRFFTDDANRHSPLGLEVVQESYVWTDPQFDDVVGVEFRVRNISYVLDEQQEGWDITSSYIGFMVDGDVGIDDDNTDFHRDDRSAFAEIDTVISPTGDENIDLHLTMGYAYDEPASMIVDDDVPGFLGVMFLGHTVDTTTPDLEEALAPRTVGIHAFRVWTPNGPDPRDDLDRYRFLRGLHDTARTIDPPSPRPEDWRFLVSAGPFARIPPGSTLTFQVAFVSGLMEDVIDPLTGVSQRRPDFTNPIAAQRIYNGFVDDDGQVVHWATSSPPPPPNIQVSPADGSVVIEWDDFPENVPDPLTRVRDFAGYQVWKAEGWRRDSNIPDDTMWRLIADFDSTELADIDTGLGGVGRYRFIDTRVHNGFWYWYAVSAYDRGTFRMDIVPCHPESLNCEPDTSFSRLDTPKFGKFSQNMTRVMPRTTSTQTLADVFVAPNPYKETAAWDLTESSVEPTGRRIKFFNLPQRATVRIYTLSGDHVITLDHDESRSAEQPGQLHWNLVTKNRQDTVSGIYLYHVAAAGGQEKIGKFVVIR